MQPLRLGGKRKKRSERDSDFERYESFCISFSLSLPWFAGRKFGSLNYLRPKRGCRNGLAPIKRLLINARRFTVQLPITNYRARLAEAAEFRNFSEFARASGSPYQHRESDGSASPVAGTREREKERGGVELKGRRCREWWWLKSARAMVPIESYQFPRAFPKQVSSRAPPRAQRRRRKEERTSGIHAPRAHEGERE
jgi:hypothetical protein